MSVCALMASFPLAGLVVFFEMTEPAGVNRTNFAGQVTQAAWRKGESKLSNKTASFAGVSHLSGVSAQLAGSNERAVARTMLASQSAANVFPEKLLANLRIGLETEYDNEDGRRFGLRIVDKQPITDQVVPNNADIMKVAPASTNDIVYFIWGQWKFGVAIEDRGEEPHLAVQKSL